jgi:uncharacterized protein (TIGR02145 family)/uncharacterized repeat protein (TIGR02543 family)
MASAKNWDSDTLDTLYAQWSASAFSVTLDKRSGSDGTSTVTVTFDAPMPDASPPELQGYNFAGYFDALSGGTQYYDSLMASAREWDKVGEATLYAHWNPIAYTISYNLNGGSNVAGNPATYTIESAEISLKDPSKPEFDFIGWYSDSSFNDSVTKITSRSVGNKELFAKWKWRGGTVTDYDGNVYTTIQIGNQVWTVENLRTTKYNDGSAIPGPSFTQTQWADLTTPAYCWYNDSSEAAYRQKWGALYNWYVVDPNNSKKIAPAGWHVPSDADWITLSNYLGGGSVAGGKMKEAGLANWKSPNEGATNSSGFLGLPGGYRNKDYNFNNKGIYGYWWSVTEYDAAQALDCFLWYYRGHKGSGRADKCSGFSVRLVRDN